jgi:hypothetical protein
VLLKNQTVALDESKATILKKWNTMGKFLENSI